MSDNKNSFVSEKKRLISNFFSLALLQGTNYLLPLIPFPYLVRTIGVENFGLLAFAAAFIMYFQIITDYGFNLTATRAVSIHRDRPEKIVEIFSAVMTIKLLLMLFSFIIMAVLVFSFEKFSAHWNIYFYTFGIVIGQTLFPIWLFQGMEQMKYITKINILSKSFFTALIFVFVTDKEDFYIVPILNSLGFIVAGIWSLWAAKKYFNTVFRRPDLSTIKDYLLDGWHIFISNIAISLYTVSTTFILGIFSGNTMVGYFAAADKIVQAVKGLINPLFQTIYPHISKKVSLSQEEGLSFIRKIGKFIALFSFAGSLLLYLNAERIVMLFLGEEYDYSIHLLQIMSPLPLMIALSNLFGIQTMLTFNRKKAFSKILVSGSALNVILSCILVPLYSGTGSAISVTITESFITIWMFAYLQNNGLQLIRTKK